MHKTGVRRQLRFLQFKNELLPTETYRQLWLYCAGSSSPEARANGAWLSLRVVMDHGCEQRLGAALLAVAENKKLLSAHKVLQERYLGKKTAPINHSCTETELASL